ncbi:MAG TPA: hypothetical protein VGH87_14785 [Polyangiaceae bacterium]|nr:hypothetical protein [Polyangiaceae bacterium]
MRRFILPLLLAIATSGCLGLPNPQSEWTSSEGGEQRSTLDDETIQAGNTFPQGCDCCCDDDTTLTAGHVHVHNVHAHVGHVGHVHVAHAGHAGHSGHH